MTDGPHALLPGRRCARGAQAGEDQNDRQLLERFAERRDEDAFAVLVSRHGSGVLGVCRRVLRHHQDAEDVSQAVFLVLAQKAGQVRWQCSVKQWLHAVAYRLSLRARGALSRRHSFERSVETLAPRREGDPAAPASAWDRLPENSHPREDPLAEVGRRESKRLIAGELAGLPEKFHAPLVLCYLEGKTNEEAAGHLGWPAGSMSRRLARARALLQERLTRRGMALLVVLVGLSAALFLPWKRPDARGPSVAQAMAPFRPVGEGGQGIEAALLRLAEDRDRGAARDHERLAALARRSALVAASLGGHAPDGRHERWRGFAEEMRTSALELADALDAREDRAAVRAARALTASCQRCHAAFRD
jgi:RNA polymerase sigma-70 factor (ECF subfamily)